jgi:hypothetical protein
LQETAAALCDTSTPFSPQTTKNNKKITTSTTMLNTASAFLFLSGITTGFVVPKYNGRSTTTALDASVGIFFGTSTGSTEEVADLIKREFGDDADGPVDVEALDGSVKSSFEKYDALVVGSEY